MNTLDSQVDKPADVDSVKLAGGSSRELTSTTLQLRTVLWRMAALVWAAEIFWLSTETFGPSFSRNVQVGILGLLHISLSDATFSILHSISRKLAHLGEYGVLSYLLYRSFGAGAYTRWQPQFAVWSIVASAAYSLTDELHQLFVRGRGASIADCGIDTAGAAIAMLLVYFWSRPFRDLSEQHP